MTSDHDCVDEGDKNFSDSERLLLLKIEGRIVGAIL